nr:MAG TPA: Host cell surface-exposed lipoprotein [Caudoviricetes sp.]
MKFQRIKDMVCGALIASMVLCSGTVAFAKVANMSIPVAYNNIKIVVDGKQLSTNKEPFTYEGTTYLPVRAVAEAVGKDVSWDGATKTVYIGAKSTDTTSTSNTSATVPTEYKSALNKAKTYSDMMHMSKKGIYNQLVSAYGEKFSKEAAQYAVDNLNADYKANALKKAETYQSTLNMSASAIYDQLVSEYGEQFTAEEAQYAIDNLK